MYILTKNKDMLIKDYVALYYDSMPEHCILCSVTKESYYSELGVCLGAYKSKERCLEIIKDITIALNRGVKCYEMPSS